MLFIPQCFAGCLQYNVLQLKNKCHIYTCTKIVLLTKISLLGYAVMFTGNLLLMFQRSFLPPSSWQLKMLVKDYWWTQLHIQEDRKLCQYHCENLKSHNIIHNESNNNPSTKQKCITLQIVPNTSSLRFFILPIVPNTCSLRFLKFFLLLHLFLWRVTSP